MRRLGFIFGFWLGLLAFNAIAGTYTLTDGTHVSGEPFIQDAGVKFGEGIDTHAALVPWSRFSNDSLKQLLHDATTSSEKIIIQAMIVDFPESNSKSGDIAIKPVETPARPSGQLGVLAIFTSPAGWFILLVFYGANVFAAYEVAMFRNRPIRTVCGLALIPFFGLASTIYFIALPTADGEAREAEGPRYTVPSSPTFAPAQAHSKSPPVEPVAPPPSYQTETPEQVAELAPPQPDLPAPIIYSRGEFSFNRRFFETKLTPFFRVVLGDAEKDMLIYIKSGRGDFFGKRISRITQAELYLQVFKDDATADEMIPFGEITEVQIRHKDLA
jgi:hypothetical protein